MIALNDDVAAVELVEIEAGGQVVQERCDHVRLLVRWSEHQYPVVSARGIPPNIGEATIQGDEHPPLVDRSGQNDIILLATKSFGKNRVGIMPSLLQHGDSTGGDVLVELDLHTSDPKFSTSSRASNAP